jgi:hypothetical protein
MWVSVANSDLEIMKEYVYLKIRDWQALEALRVVKKSDQPLK